MSRGLRASRESRHKGVPGTGGRLYVEQACEVPVPKCYWPVGMKGAVWACLQMPMLWPAGSAEELGLLSGHGNIYHK